MLVSISTHASLLARLAGGTDAGAWEDFQDRYGELIRRFASAYGLQPADCDDAAQEALLALTKAMPGFEYDPAKGSFRAYLKTVTLHIVVRIRQNRGMVPLSTDRGDVARADGDADLAGIWDAEWRLNHIRRAMKRIEPEFRNVELRAFQLYAMESREASETAAMLGISVNQVYQSKSRILKRLTDVVAEQVQDEG